MVRRELSETPRARLTAVLLWLGIAVASWYYKPRKRQSRPQKPRWTPLPHKVEKGILAMAEKYPFWGYKRIAVLCRRDKLKVSNRQVLRVFRNHDLLRKRQPNKKAELAQTAKLVDLLPTGPNELWQMDVTYIHVAGSGWWYAVTVIDYFSRYLLALHFTPSYAAHEVIIALKSAREEAERVHGPLMREPFLLTDNGTSFLAKRFSSFIKDDYSHVRIQYRSLLERFHQTLKKEEVYWRIYEGPADARRCLQEFHERYNTIRPHWALIPAEGGDPLTPEEVYAHGAVTRIPAWQGWAIKAKEKLEKLQQQEEIAG